MRRALMVSIVLVLSLAPPPATAGAEPPRQGLSEQCLQRLPVAPATLEEDTHLPVGVLVPCPGIRPGARVWSEPGGGCTLNFVFRGTSRDAEGNPVDEGLFIGTAGHCVMDEDGEEVWPEGQGPVAMDAANERFGQHAYAVLGDNYDFSLIRVDDAREDEVRPDLCHFGGPAGTSTGATEGDVVHHFGQGLVYGDTVPGRSGVVASGTVITGPHIVLFQGAAIFGDSGSPLIERDSDALGVVVAILVADPTMVVASYLPDHVERAEQAMGMELELVSGPTH